MSTSHLNEHGQPLAHAFHRERLTTRMIDELLGICKGVVADDVVTLEEAAFLQQWMERNRNATNEWPANVLYARIRHVLADGVLDEGEAAELLQLLRDITGGVLPEDDGSGSKSTSLPLCEPAPPVFFEDRRFCFTGKCVSGTRKQCEGEVLSRRGGVKASPTRDTHYLVIGEIGSRDWMHSTHGRKIERAVTLRDEGHGIAIISERYWSDSLG